MRRVPIREIDRNGVDKYLPTPLYHQINLIFRGKIYDGSYPDHALLPGEPQLGRMFGERNTWSPVAQAPDQVAIRWISQHPAGREIDA